MASVSKRWRYRTRAATSEVDETLFGNSKPKKEKDGEYVQIITKDLIRNVRIRNKGPSNECMVIPPSEFERIKSTSHVLTKVEREALKEAQQKRKQEEIKAAAVMKNQLIEADLRRKDNHALTELELEAKELAQNLVERAAEMRLEQEEEIQKLNKLILDVKCKAALDAQIEEKKQIQKEFAEEEMRLDTMMEVERRRALETEEHISELRRQQRFSGMQQITNQIQKRLEEKRMQEELKECESQLMRKKQEKMNEEDLKALERKKEKQQRMQEEIRHVNEEMKQAKEKKKEEERQADMRAAEFTRKKVEQEAEREDKQRRLKKEKEVELAQLRARLEKAKDDKAEQDEIRARRNQESANREWRRKEKELAERKAREEAMLREAHQEQVRFKEHSLSMEVAREKAELERVLKVQQQEIVKQKETEEKQREKALRHAEALRQDVRESELAAVNRRRERYKEASQQLEEARQRRTRLEELKEKKLRELKVVGLPESYCRAVERKAHLP